MYPFLPSTVEELRRYKRQLITELHTDIQRLWRRAGTRIDPIGFGSPNLAYLPTAYSVDCVNRPPCVVVTLAGFTGPDCSLLNGEWTIPILDCDEGFRVRYGATFDDLSSSGGVYSFVMNAQWLFASRKWQVSIGGGGEASGAGVTAEKSPVRVSYEGDIPVQPSSLCLGGTVTLEQCPSSS